MDRTPVSFSSSFAFFRVFPDGLCVIDPALRVITGHNGAAGTRAIIVCSYPIVCFFAVTMGSVSESRTYPADIFPLKVRAKAISLPTAASWLFNFAAFAFAWAVPPGLSSMADKTCFNFVAFITTRSSTSLRRRADARES